MKGRFAKIGLVLTVSISMLMLWSPPAHADSLNRFVSSQTVGELGGAWLTLDSNWDGDVYVLGWNGGDYQRWRITVKSEAGGSIAEVKNIATGRCLDSNWDRAVYTLGCNGGNYQLWHIAHVINEKHTRLWNIATGYCLHTNTWDVYTYPCNADYNELWRKFS